MRLLGKKTGRLTPEVLYISTLIDTERELGAQFRGVTISRLQQSLRTMTWDTVSLNLFWQVNLGRHQRFALFGISRNCHRELSDNFISHLLHKSRKCCESQLLQTKKFPVLSPELRRISLTKFHTGAREKVISLTGRHYVIEGTFYCIKEWGAPNNKEKVAV